MNKNKEKQNQGKIGYENGIELEKVLCNLFNSNEVFAQEFLKQNKIPGKFKFAQWVGQKHVKSILNNKTKSKVDIIINTTKTTFNLSVKNNIGRSQFHITSVDQYILGLNKIYKKDLKKLNSLLTKWCLREKQVNKKKMLKDLNDLKKGLLEICLVKGLSCNKVNGVCAPFVKYQKDNEIPTEYKTVFIKDILNDLMSGVFELSSSGKGIVLKGKSGKLTLKRYSNAKPLSLQALFSISKF